MSETATTNAAEARAETPSGEVLTMSAAASWLGMSYNHLRKLVQKAEGPKPTFYVGRKPRWTVAALRAWLASCDQRNEARQPARGRARA